MDNKTIFKIFIPASIFAALLMGIGISTNLQILLESKTHSLFGNVSIIIGAISIIILNLTLGRKISGIIKKM